MKIVPLIECKKRGGSLSAADIEALISGYTAGDVPDYQMAAFLMAVWFKGMDPAETTALTGAMLHSGEELDFSDIGGETADKHSTGGIGDKVSLLLAPLAAACDLRVPMLSGRGLGHTGGTLDKLEAIPGYRIHLDNADFRRVVGDVGCSIVGQGPKIAPADGRIYALRDVTGTVDCVPLITASILSKKLAAGPRTIVIDLKVGGGAFMTDRNDAEALARALIGTAAHWDRRLSVVFSDMSQPLGRAVGHSIETVEAFAALRPGGRGTAPEDLVRLTEVLVAEMLTTSGLAPDEDSALKSVRDAWDSGAAFDRLLAWVAAQGGRMDPDRDDFGLTIAPAVTEVPAPRAGFVKEIACREIGYALGELGGTRAKVEDSLDLTAGIDFLTANGGRGERGEPLAIIHSTDRTRAESAAARIAAAVTIADERKTPPQLVQGRLGSDRP